MAMMEGPLDKRKAIVNAARRWIGTPYVHQASLKGAGCDCLGLVRGVWREIYGSEPEAAPAYTPDWGERFGQELMFEACRRHLIEREPDVVLQPGDVILFRWRPNLPAKHCAIVTGKNRIVHSLQNHTVQEVDIPRSWRRKIAAHFSFPPTIRRPSVHGLARTGVCLPCHGRKDERLHGNEPSGDRRLCAAPSEAGRSTNGRETYKRGKS
jgi:NlpC/P60 family putative phage cell wall peptidase